MGEYFYMDIDVDVYFANLNHLNEDVSIDFRSYIL